MYPRIGTGVVIAAITFVILAFAFPRFMGLVVDWCRPADTRTQAQKTIDTNPKQVKMLSKHRELFEAVAKGDAAKAEELRAKLDIWFGQDGPAINM